METYVERLLKDREPEWPADPRNRYTEVVALIEKDYITLESAIETLGHPGVVHCDDPHDYCGEMVEDALRVVTLHREKAALEHWLRCPRCYSLGVVSRDRDIGGGARIRCQYIKGHVNLRHWSKSHPHGQRGEEEFVILTTHHTLSSEARP